MQAYYYFHQFDKIYIKLIFKYKQKFKFGLVKTCKNNIIK